MDRLDIDKNGSLQSMTKPKVTLMASLFVIGKLFIAKLMLRPLENGLKVNKTGANNFKIIGSTFYWIYLELINYIIPHRDKDKPDIEDE